MRLVAVAIVWVAAALVAGGFLLSNLFREPLQKSFDQRLDFLLESLISAVEFTPRGELASLRDLGDARFDGQYSGWYWQVSRLGDGAVLDRSRSMWDFELPLSQAPASANREFYARTGPLSQTLRVAVQVIQEEGLPGKYVFFVAGDTSEVSAAVDEFNFTLLWSLGVLGIGLVAAVFVQVRFGLLPLRQVSRSLSDVREGRASRLDGEFPTEIRPLTEEMNGLIEHTAEVLARARAHVGNLAHALKTPLAVLTNEGDQPSADASRVVQQQTDLMRSQIDHYLSRARAIEQAPILRGKTDVLPVIQSLARTLEKIYAAKAVSIQVTAPDNLAFRGEQPDLEEMLGNLADNACKWTSGEVSIEARPLKGAGGLMCAVTVDDDGPGVAPDLREELFGRGRRTDESKPGSGLGLSIVRDIAALYGGSAALEDSPKGGLRAVLILPAALNTTAES